MFLYARRLVPPLVSFRRRSLERDPWTRCDGASYLPSAREMRASRTLLRIVVFHTIDGSVRRIIWYTII
ncbi:hypothetical protein Y026_5198 [Burkholderia pseudomallei TSV28]|nr:hypothetical protein Y026_5198 [Burkholderia pseudomallei TSV28]